MRRATPAAHAPRTPCRAGRAAQSATRRCCPAPSWARGGGAAQAPRRPCQRPRHRDPRAPRAAPRTSSGSHTKSRLCSALSSLYSCNAAAAQLRRVSSAATLTRALPSRPRSARPARHVAATRLQQPLDGGVLGVRARQGVHAGSAASAPAGQRTAARKLERDGDGSATLRIRGPTRRQYSRFEQRTARLLQSKNAGTTAASRERAAGTAQLARRAPQAGAGRRGQTARCYLGSVSTSHKLATTVAATHVCWRALRRRAARADAAARSSTMHVAAYACCMRVACRARRGEAHAAAPGLRCAAGRCRRCGGRAASQARQSWRDGGQRGCAGGAACAQSWERGRAFCW